MNIEQELSELKEARELLGSAKSAADLELENFKLTNGVYSHQRGIVAMTQDRIELLEEAIKNAAIAEYKATGNKKPHEKVAVKIFKTFSIKDSKAVFNWAWDNLPAAFKLDEKKIEKYAQEFGDVAGTEKGEEARAQIASEL